MNQSHTTSEIVDKLKQASSGLLWSSESDYPFEVFSWSTQKPLTASTVIHQSGHAPDTPVEVVPLDEFFQNMTHEQDWHNDEERKTVAKFKALVETLKTNLNDVQVFRLGSVEIDVYIVGKTSSGDLVGLSTKVVET